MQNNGFYIKSIIAIGANVILSRVDFSQGCNLLFGPSEKGKSSVFSIIEYMLGKEENPKPVKEGNGYDTFFMEYVTRNDSSVHTVCRKLDEKQLMMKDCSFEKFDSSGIKGTLFTLTKKKGYKDYSEYLMGLNGFPEGLMIRSTTTSKASFKYTWIRHLILANENRIVSEKPIFNPLNETNTRQQEKSVIYYLTSGDDDSSFSESEPDKIRRARYKGKIELTQENIDAVNKRLEEIGDVDYADFKDDAIIKAMQSKLKEEELNLNGLYEKRRSFEDEKHKLRSKSIFVNEFIGRMEMLESHYRTDMERFEYLFEGASLLELITEKHECPVCHSEINDKSQIDDGYQDAIQAEANTLRTKINDIKRLILQKKTQQKKLAQQVIDTERKIEVINREINEFIPKLTFLKELLAKYQDNLERKAEVKFLSEESSRLYKKLAILNQEKTKPQKEAYIRTTNIKDDFCDMLKDKLVEWNVIKESDTVIFDEDGFDFMLGGKRRLSCGKGARGVTCAAILMTLVEYCDAKDIPFSSLLVLDSPITAHFSSGKLEPKDTTQYKFFKYCNEQINNYQLIIIDNKSPNESEKRELTNINYIEFSENGRNGFFIGQK